MNKIYRIVWNHSLMIWTVVSELGKTKSKGAALKAVSFKIAKGHRFLMPILLIGMSNAYAVDISGYTEYP